MPKWVVRGSFTGKSARQSASGFTKGTISMVWTPLLATIRATPSCAGGAGAFTGIEDPSQAASG